MSINNQVVSSLPQITQSDANGNIIGLSIQSDVNSLVPTAGTLVVTSNISNANFSTSIGNGNINTGGNVKIGGGLLTNGSSQFGTRGNSSLVLIISTVTATGANTGSFTVSSNVANAQLSTSIGNGVIYTGSNITSSATVFANNAVVVNRGDVATTGITNGTVFYGGSNTTSQPVVLLNGSNGGYSGLQLATVGAESWFIGRDPSTNTGNYIVRSNAAVNNFTIVPGSGTVTFDSTNRNQTLSFSGNVNYNAGAGNFHSFNNTTFLQLPVLSYAGIIPQPITNNSFTLIQFAQDFANSSVTTSQFGFSLSGGGTIFTNTTSSDMYISVNVSLSWVNNNTGTRVILISQDTTASDTGWTYARVQTPAVQNLYQDMICSATFKIAASGVFCVKAYQNSGATLNLGTNTTHPTSITITRI